jgi:(p)ppGpp synthase/HD superfamily hydrolase
LDRWDILAKTILSADFLRALLDAEHYHRAQVRNSTEIPYLSHLLGVCSLVIEAGGSETEAIAALLHDAAEDAGGRQALEAIRQNYGSPVADIVEGCSDALPDPGTKKPPWAERKEKYIQHLRSADKSTLLVSAADKLHNLRAIHSDYTEIGDQVFQRFKMEGDKRALTLWYYRSLLDVYLDPRSAADARRRRLTTELGSILHGFDSQVAIAS